MTELLKVVSLNTHVKRLCSEIKRICCFRTYWAYVKILKRRFTSDHRWAKWL